jgi:isoquinoline 1-oxidoreductase alpha subunit
MPRPARTSLESGGGRGSSNVKGDTMKILTINGFRRVVDMPDETPLLWVIREHLQMTGTKFGCGAGLCGSCTVHLNGEAVRSCQTSLSDAAEGEVTTIEGLDPQGEHPLQRAWIKHQVPQCGWCQSGQIMQAASLLRKNANPSDAEIVETMDGNLCRCMSYVRIKAAIQDVRDQMNSKIKKKEA